MSINLFFLVIFLLTIVEKVRIIKTSIKTMTGGLENMKERKNFSKHDKARIVAFWKETYSKNIDFFYKNGFSDDKLENVFDFRFEGEKGICFCCGKVSRLQVCHIIPWSITKDDSYSNLFLLCDECHKESPDFAIKKYFFQFIAKKEQDLTKKYRECFELTYEIIKEIGMIVDKKQEIALKNTKLNREEITKKIFGTLEQIEKEANSLFAASFGLATTHGVKYSESTRAAIKKECIANIKKRTKELLFLKQNHDTI